jgi:hypothetical protein
MTLDKDRKRIIRLRMQKTGESYTAARAQILSKATSKPAPAPAIDYAAIAGMADDKVAAKTGRTWSQWVKVLDRDHASEKPHREIAELLHGKHNVQDWWAQTVTVGYERIKGLRDRGQRRGGGYEATKSKTFNVPLDLLFKAFTDDAMRHRWIGAKTTLRKASPPKSIRLQWTDKTIIPVWVTAKGAKTQVAVTQTNLPSKAAADEAKKEWSVRLNELATLLAKSALGKSA